MLPGCASDRCQRIHVVLTGVELLALGSRTARFERFQAALPMFHGSPDRGQEIRQGRFLEDGRDDRQACVDDAQRRLHKAPEGVINHSVGEVFFAPGPVKLDDSHNAYDC